MRFLNLLFIIGTAPGTIGFSVWVQESKWQHALRPHLNAPWVYRILRKIGFREHLVDFRRHSISLAAQAANFILACVASFAHRPWVIFRLTLWIEKTHSQIQPVEEDNTIFVRKSSG